MLKKQKCNFIRFNATKISIKMQQTFFFLAVWATKVNVTTRSTICMIKSEGVREKVYLDYLNRIIWRFIENSSGLKMEKFKLARF